MKITNAALIQEDWGNEIDIKVLLKYGRYNLSLSKNGNNIVAAAGSFVDYNGTLYACSTNETLYSSALSDGKYFLTSAGTPASTLSFTISTNTSMTIDYTKNRVLDSSSNQVYVEIIVKDGVYSFSDMTGRNHNTTRKATYKGRDLSVMLADIIAYDRLFPLEELTYHDAVNDWVLSDMGIALKLRNGDIRWSSDMMTWTNGTCSDIILTNYNFTGGAYHNGKFVVVGVYSSTWCILYSEDGKTWSRVYNNTSGSGATKMRWVNDRFLAWGNGRLVHSLNGKDWTLSTIDSTTTDIVYGAGVWVSARPGAIYSSTNLSSWTLRLTHANNGVAWNGSLFCDAPSGSSSACVQYTSSNGITWTAPNNTTWRAQIHFFASSIEYWPMNKITGGDGYFIASIQENTAVGAYDYYLISSTDGINWQLICDDTQTVATAAPNGPLITHGIGRANNIRFNDHMFYSWGANAYVSPMLPLVYSPSFFVHKYRSSK